MNRIAGKNGFTLLEMTVVIMVMMSLLGIGLFASRQFGNWQLGRHRFGGSAHRLLGSAHVSG